MKKYINGDIIASIILTLAFAIQACQSQPRISDEDHSFIYKNLVSIYEDGDINIDIFDSSREDTLSIVKLGSSIRYQVHYYLNNSDNWVAVEYKNGEPIWAEWHCPTDDSFIEEAVYDDFELSSKTYSAFDTPKLQELGVYNVQVCSHPEWAVGIHNKENGERTLFVVFNKTTLPW